MPPFWAAAIHDHVMHPGPEREKVCSPSFRISQQEDRSRNFPCIRTPPRHKFDLELQPNHNHRRRPHPTEVVPEAGTPRRSQARLRCRGPPPRRPLGGGREAFPPLSTTRKTTWLHESPLQADQLVPSYLVGTYFPCMRHTLPVSVPAFRTCSRATEEGRGSANLSGRRSFFFFRLPLFVLSDDRRG